MKRVAKILVGLTLLGTSGGAIAQSFNQQLSRYRAAKIDCEQAFRQRLERPRNGCIGPCLSTAEAARDRCLLTAENRYRAALRRALELPRR